MSTPINTCGTKHIGRCTDSPLFSREDAAVRLIALGWTFKTEGCEWVKGIERGRLCWSPDFCNQDDLSKGTSFWLRRPAEHIELGKVIINMEGTG